MRTPLSALEKAIRTAGSQAQFARDLGVSPPTVQGWRELGRAPDDRCAVIEALYGVPVERLRPDRQWERDDSGNVVAYRVPVAA